MELGILSSQQVSEQVKGKLGSEGRVDSNEILATFVNLIERSYLVQCNKKKPTELKDNSTLYFVDMNN